MELSKPGGARALVCVCVRERGRCCFRMRAISCACTAPSSSSPRGARPRGRRRCPVFRSAAAIALLHFLQKKKIALLLLRCMAWDELELTCLQGR